jgi:hypothetical protein
VLPVCTVQSAVLGVTRYLMVLAPPATIRKHPKCVPKEEPEPIIVTVILPQEEVLPVQLELLPILGAMVQVMAPTAASALAAAAQQGRMERGHREEMMVIVFLPVVLPAAAAAQAEGPQAEVLTKLISPEAMAATISPVPATVSVAHMETLLPTVQPEQMAAAAAQVDGIREAMVSWRTVALEAREAMALNGTHPMAQEGAEAPVVRLKMPALVLGALEVTAVSMVAEPAGMDRIFPVMTGHSALMARKESSSSRIGPKSSV